MRKLFEVGIAIIIAVSSVSAKQVVSKYTRPDTTIKPDTIISVDTIIKTTTYKDTSLFMKQDSVIHKGMKKGKL